MALDPRLILSGVQAGIENARPFSNLMAGAEQAQRFAGEQQRQGLLAQQGQQQAAMAPLQREALEQNIATGGIQQQIAQAELDALGVPDVPTAKELAFNAAKLSALPTPEAKIAEIGRLKNVATQAGRTTQNLNELEAAYTRSPEEGDQLLAAGVQAFERSGLLSPVEKADAIKQKQLEIREQELALKQQIEQRQQTKLSGPLEQALLKSQDDVAAAQQASSEFDILANQVEDADLTGGVAATTSETFKQLLGSQDDVTEMRRRFNKVRLSEGLKNLPPGPATDKDMEQAFKGVPPENAPASQIASFLRGAAKMARFDAGYNQFKSDYITDNSTAKGLNREWRSSVNSSILERDVTIAEIYAEAAASGLTPEEVKAELGIQ